MVTAIADFIARRGLYFGLLVAFLSLAAAHGEALRFTQEETENGKAPMERLNAYLRTLTTPVYIEWDRPYQFVTAEAGDGLNAHQLQRHPVKVLDWDSCGAGSVFLIAYPQLRYERGYVQSTLNQRELVFVNGSTIVGRKALGEPAYADEMKKSFVRVDKDCGDAVVWLDKKFERYAWGGSSVLGVYEGEAAADVHGLRSVSGGRLLIDQYFGGSSAISLLDWNTGRVRQLDKTTRLIRLESPTENCWLRSEFRPQERNEVVCADLSKEAPLDVSVLPQKTTSGVARDKVIPTGSRQALIWSIERKQTLQRRTSLVMDADRGETASVAGAALPIGGGRAWVHNYHHTHESRFDLLNMEDGRRLAGFDLFPYGELNEARISGDRLLITAINSYHQRTFLVARPDGTLSVALELPHLRPQTRERILKLTARDGFEHLGHLTAPAELKGKPQAVFVYVHGGGCHLSSEVSRRYVLSDEILEVAKTGIPVWAITYRNDAFFGPPENDPRPRTAENCGVEEMNDIESGITAAHRLYPGVPVFLWGRSHGGYLVNVFSTQDERIREVKGVVSEVGIWAHGFGPDFVPVAVKHYNPERAPLAHIGALDVPFFMYHGGEDVNANYKMHGEAFLREAQMSAARTSGELTYYRHPTKPIRALIAARQPHSIRSDEVHRALVAEILRFVRDTLQAKP